MSRGIFTRFCLQPPLQPSAAAQPLPPLQPLQPVERPYCKPDHISPGMSFRLELNWRGAPLPLSISQPCGSLGINHPCSYVSVARFHYLPALRLVALCEPRDCILEDSNSGGVRSMPFRNGQ